MRIDRLALLCSFVSVWAGACLGREKPSGPRLDVRVAALTLEGPDEVCYDLRVENAGGTVWARGNPLLTALGDDQDGGGTAGAPDQDTICSSRFGNSTGGDVTYIGTCDASSDSDTSRPGVQNRVTLWVDGLYKSGADLGDWQDPCEAGCSLSVDCNENEDALAEFNLTLMRQANQGFFDVVVNFEDIFCSAKLDTCYPDGPDADTADDPIRLIHGGDAVRDWTGVFGFACSAGAGASSSTTLMFGRILVTCGSTVFELDPRLASGNAYVTASGKTLHYGIYRGGEALQCAAGSCNKAYWNVAVSVDDLASFGGTCRLTLSATATDGDGGFTAGLPTAVGQAYPYIDVDADLTIDGAGLCQRHAVNQSDAVKTTYKGSIDGLVPPTAMYHQFNGTSVSPTGAGVGTVEICPDNGESSCRMLADTSGGCAYYGPPRFPGLNHCACRYGFQNEVRDGVGTGGCECSVSHVPNGNGGCYPEGQTGGYCGDERLDEGEECEWGGANCPIYRVCECPPGAYFPDGNLGCALDPACGNDIVDGSAEECDGGVLCTPTCACEEGYTTDPDTNGCHCVTGACLCGNGTIEEDEECDGAEHCTIDCTCAVGYDPDGSGACVSTGEVEVCPAGSDCFMLLDTSGACTYFGPPAYPGFDICMCADEFSPNGAGGCFSGP